MRRFRFSIARLLGVVLLFSVALAALRDPTDAWDSSILGLTLLILLTAVLLAVHRTDRQRAYWLGFALSGWTYLVTTFISPIETRLPTTRGLAYMDAKLPGPEPLSEVLYRILVPGDQGPSGPPQPVIPDLTASGASDWAYTWMFTGAAPPGPNGTPKNFVRIGHSLLALGMALIGGRLSRRLYDEDHARMAGYGDHPLDNGRRP